MHAGYNAGEFFATKYTQFLTEGTILTGPGSG